MNENYTDKKFKLSFQEAWSGKQDSADPKGTKIIQNPFRCAVVEDLFASSEFLTSCLRELSELQRSPRNNDLFKFEATSDLNSIKSPNVSQLCSLFKGPVRKWMSQLTGIKLHKHIAISCSQYKYSDTLLCHNDELDGRRLAFILYLVPPWKESYGGSLDLFSVDSELRPDRICETIVPSYNTFAFFEVSPKSYHQVREVFVNNETRISINGWFHGEPIEYPPPRIIKPPIYLLPGNIEEHEVYSWISPLYLDETSQSDIRKQFENNSEISLSDFLKQKKYDELCKAFQEEGLPWQWTGPPDQKHYQICHRKKSPKIVKDFLSLMQSEALFLVLSQLTGLQLHHLAKEESDSSDSEGSGTDLEPSEEDTEEPPVINDSDSFQETDDADTSNKRKKKSVQKSNKKVKANEYSSESVNTLGMEWSCDVERKHLKKLRKSAVQDENMKAEVTSQIQKWTPGSYSLMRDDDFNDDSEFMLDARFFANVPSAWTPGMGGTKIYAAKGEEEELLDVHPDSNCLCLVYRDKDTCSFTKFINCKANRIKKFEYQELHFQYRKLDVKKEISK